MKKQLLFALLLASSGAFAQKFDVIKTAKTPTQQIKPSHKAAVLVDQQVVDQTLPTTIDNGLGFSLFGADDVIFTNAVTLQSYKVIGSMESYSNFAEAYRGGHFIIFEDNNGKPASKPADAQNAKVNFDFDETNTAVSYELTNDALIFTIDLTKINNNSGINLDANKTYWIAFSPKIDVATTESMWSMFASGDANQDAVFIDENSSVNPAWSDWVSIKELGSETNSLNMLIEGISDTTLGVKDLYSTASTFYPNPSSSQITFKDADKISKVQIYNLAGAIVLETNQKSADVSKLTKGNYIIKQILKDGNTISSKFIKN